MKPVDVFVQITGEEQILIRLNAEMPVSRVISELARKMAAEDAAESQAAYKVYLARQVTYSETTTLDDIKLAAGDFLLMVPLVSSAVQLRLAPQKRFDHPGWMIDEPEALIGRRDVESGIIPDVDLSPFTADPTTISRQLAYLREKGDAWTIQLHKDAHSAVYVDRARLEPGQVVPLRDSSILAFGGTPSRPDFQLQVTLAVKK